MSQQQPLVQISDFTFSMNQEPITINYLVDIQEFTADQIEQLKSSVTTIAKANDTPGHNCQRKRYTLLQFSK